MTANRDGEDPTAKESENYARALDYARGETIGRKRCTSPQVAVAAFVAALVQIPWAFACVLVALSARQNPAIPSGNPPTLLEIAFIRGIEILPSVAAVAFGYYSLKLNGLRWENALGLIGLFFGAAVVIPTLLGFSMIVDWLPYPLVVLLGWIAQSGI
jgi:hypothetical protein